LLSYKMDKAKKKTPIFMDIMNFNNENFSNSQVKWKTALKIYKEELGVLNKDKYDEKLSKFKSDLDANSFKREQSLLLKEAKLFACLQNVHQVKGLTWVPKLTLQNKPCCYADKTLKGHYVCRYVDENQ